MMDDFHAPRRRRLNNKGIAVVLILLVLVCALGLGIVKLGLMVWNAPVTAKVANSSVRIGTAVADAAMEHYEVPKEVRQVVTEEADTLRQEVFAGGTAAEQAGASGGTGVAKPEAGKDARPATAEERDTPSRAR